MADESDAFEYKKETFREFLWNPETKQFLGRDGTSWAKIGLFYLIFYSCLAGFFAIMMVVFYQTLDLNYKPTYIPGDGSSILRSPALGFRPRPREGNVESTLIWYKNGDNDDIEHWVKALNKFIKPYEGTEGVSGETQVDCQTQERNKDQVCMFDDAWMQGNCHKEENWGFDRDSPCIVLKLNKMFGWVPDVYENMTELPSKMPKSLKDHIEKSTRDAGGKMPKMVWVSCIGENPADEEYIGSVTYQPWQGFPAYYFPYLNNPGYLPPIVGVQFNKPQSNVLINIECRVWAKNIVHDRSNRLGMVHFELLKD